MSDLDLLGFPLTGRQLIEASAGTGKTYSITALHLRALLGVGVPTPVPLDRLLVVTFTNAAADELRGRVRSRLVAMRDRLRIGTPTNDDFNESLATAIPTDEVPLAIARLDVALQSLDTAAIYTIHGFCLRVLREYAFDSGVPFEQELIADDYDYMHAAVTDAWRRLVYQVDAAHEMAAARLYDCWPSPSHLWKDVKTLLVRPDVEWRGIELDSVAAAGAALHDAIVAFKAVARELCLADALSQSNFSTEAKKGLAARARIAALRALVTLPGAQGTGPDDEPLVAFIARYTGASFASANRHQKKKGVPFDGALTAAAAEGMVAVDRQLRACALRDVIRSARVESVQEKTRRGLLSPDDVLERTSAALSGADGAGFAHKLRQRYPIAMIDEFQDTDPLQWRIFNRIYAVGGNATCVLIGDPKQAIYGFRGADIFSYLDARVAIGAAHTHRLSVTRRATPRLANGLNALYGQAQTPQFLLPGIDYVPVQSALDKENTGFARAGVDQPPLRFWHLDLAGKLSISKSAMVQRMASIAAERIDALLRDEYTLDGAPLAPGDLAILVRDHIEADAMRRALARRGRDVAFLNRGSVFASEGAGLVRLLLIALSDPNDDARVRAVLASKLGGWGATELAQSMTDDAGWQVQLERFHRLAEISGSRGVLAMLRAAVREFELAGRWLPAPDGARLLTDMRHVGEMLQSESARLGGGARLQRWLEQRMADTQPCEEHLVRLESDEALLKIVTFHGAKGLEYPVVILPFVSAARVSTQGVYHERDEAAASGVVHRAVLDISDASHQEVDRERLAEDLRLLYVGLTRAKRACFVGVANCVSKGVEMTASALGRLLLSDGTAVSDGAIAAALVQLTSRCADIAVERTAASAEQRMTAGAKAPASEALHCREFIGRIDTSWRIASYSSITRDANADYTAPGADDEDPASTASMHDGSDVDAAIQYQFSRGANAGVLLHKLLERWPAADAGPNLQNEFVASELRAAGIAHDTARVSAVVGWIEQIRTLRLAPLAIALRDLVHVRAELEFQLPLARVPTARLWQILQRHGYRADALPSQSLHGMLKGFIDLVFEHDGRYCIVDYKSNFLGGHAGAYAHANLVAAMRSHRYDLQFLFYALALRRWLAVHGTPGATLDVFYLFLRGVSAPGGGIYHHVPSPAVLDELDGLFDGTTLPAAATSMR